MQGPGVTTRPQLLRTSFQDGAIYKMGPRIYLSKCIFFLEVIGFGMLDIKKGPKIRFVFEQTRNKTKGATGERPQWPKSYWGPVASVPSTRYAIDKMY